MISFSKFLKKERTAKKMTQKEMAKYLNVSIMTYQNWEQGSRIPHELIQASIKFSMTGEVK